MILSWPNFQLEECRRGWQSRSCTTSWIQFLIMYQSTRKFHSLRRMTRALSVVSWTNCLGARSPFTTFLVVENVRPSYISVGFCLNQAFVLYFIFLNVQAADVLLWRNKKISASVLGGATVVWVLFEWLNYNFLSLACFALIIALLLQFLWTNASSMLNR